MVHILPPLVSLCNQWLEQNIDVLFISSNDVENYPADSPELMKELAEKYQFKFPYLYDEKQEVALAYQAACTPDFSSSIPPTVSFIEDSLMLLGWK